MLCDQTMEICSYSYRYSYTRIWLDIIANHLLPSNIDRCMECPWTPDDTGRATTRIRIMWKVYTLESNANVCEGGIRWSYKRNYVLNYILLSLLYSRTDSSFKNEQYFQWIRTKMLLLCAPRLTVNDLFCYIPNWTPSGIKPRSCRTRRILLRDFLIVILSKRYEL